VQSQDLPALLEGKGRESGISMERALKQVLHLLETRHADSDEETDMVEASIDDVKMMLGRIRH
jgi:hypothetical protein